MVSLIPWAIGALYKQTFATNRARLNCLNCLRFLCNWHTHWRIDNVNKKQPKRGSRIEIFCLSYHLGMARVFLMTTHDLCKLNFRWEKWNKIDYRSPYFTQKAIPPLKTDQFSSLHAFRDFRIGQFLIFITHC